MAASMTLRKAYLVSTASLVLSIGFLGVIRYRPGTGKSSIHLDQIPLRPGGWEGEEIPISLRQKEALGTDSVILRVYRKGEKSVRFYLLGSSGNRWAFHPPQYCYVGGRTELAEKGHREIEWGEKTVRANRYVFSGPRGKSLVYYWYTFGEKNLTGYYSQQLKIMTSLLTGGIRPSLLIRVSVEGIKEPEAGDRVIREFIREAMPEIDRTLSLN